jgi:putative membrane protein
MISTEYAKDAVNLEDLYASKKAVVYRHIAWLTALRYAMRQPRKWEVFEEHHTNREWSKMIHIPERAIELKDELARYLNAGDLEYTMGKNNKAAAILFLQSGHIRDLKERGIIWEFSFLELENILQELFTLQGKTERIKNFPYPRQYATLSHLFVRIFLVLLPFAIIPEFSRLGESLANNFPMISSYFVWVGVPFCAVVSWVFHTMERIGRVGEDPFEGSANDVPISTIARGIEIDLRQLLDEGDESIPEQFAEQYHVQM